MQIYVEIVGSLFLSEMHAYQTELEVEEGITVLQLGMRLGIPEELCQMALVNGSAKTGFYPLQNRDMVVYYTHLEEEIEEQPVIWS